MCAHARPHARLACLIAHAFAQHTLTDGAGKFHRFLAVVIDIRWGHNRTFDVNGIEIETEQATIDRIRTGYAKWETVLKADPNALNATQILTRLGGVGIPKTWYEDGAKVCCRAAFCFLRCTRLSSRSGAPECAPKRAESARAVGRSPDSGEWQAGHWRNSQGRHALLKHACIGCARIAHVAPRADQNPNGHAFCRHCLVEGRDSANQGHVVCGRGR